MWEFCLRCCTLVLAEKGAKSHCGTGSLLRAQQPQDHLVSQTALALQTVRERRELVAQRGAALDEGASVTSM